MKPRGFVKAKADLPQGPTKGNPQLDKSEFTSQWSFRVNLELDKTKTKGSIIADGADHEGQP